MLTALALTLQIAVATPAPPPVLTGGFGRPPAAVARARRSVTFTVPSRITPVYAQAADPAPSRQVASEEAVWRGRAASLRSGLAAAESEYAAVSASTTVVTHGAPGEAHAVLLAVRQAALAPYEARVTAARRALDSLPEDCRRDGGCQPGWVR